ncbi:MAG TPA: hypothetical protein VMB18_04140 [Terriglobales bacterium]|nr:hypothetical protein [Terriglobales bacterium]
MRNCFASVLILLGCSLLAFSQTADELINKNIEARGGMDKIKAVQTIRVTGKQVSPGGFTISLTVENKRPNLVRTAFSLQGMTGVEAYDGSTGWRISPFGGKKDPQLMGEDDVRDMLIDSDFDGPLVDYKAKGNTVEYMGHDTVDGDDALRLKVTLKDGDIVYYYLDPDAYLVIREERQEFIRGSVREHASEMGSYKPIHGVMYPFSISSGPKDDPTSWSTITIDKVEVNLPLEDSDFALPASLKKEAPKP